MRKLPPLTELRAFEAAARFRSFKVAAAKLGVTPTAVSHQIKLLEAYCGQALFRRQPRPITLTWAGEQLFPVVRDGFGSFVEAINFVRGGGPGNSPAPNNDERLRRAVAGAEIAAMAKGALAPEA
jgi:LysR family transcriptional regulator, glycine cleavage system transcriptional activator